MPHSAALTFSWTTRIPQQLPTSSRVPLPIFWLTRIPRSRNQRQVTFRSLFSFLVNQGSKPQLPTSSRIRLRTFWLIRIPSSSNQRQAAFRSLVFFPANRDSPAAANQQQSSASVFLANQDSQQQQPTRSGIPQPGTFPGQPVFPTGSYQPAVEMCSRFPSQPRFPAAAIYDKRRSAALFFFPGQPGLPSSYHRAADFGFRFSG